VVARQTTRVLDILYPLGLMWVLSIAKRAEALGTVCLRGAIGWRLDVYWPGSPERRRRLRL